LSPGLLFSDSLINVPEGGSKSKTPNADITLIGLCLNRAVGIAAFQLIMALRLLLCAVCYTCQWSKATGRSRS
jgi:hypothetical protein